MMNHRKSVVLLLAFVGLSAQWCQASDLKLWYEQPAEEWNECLPVGNGRMGVMVGGDPNREVLYLNEETLWSGHPKDKNNAQAKEILPQIRDAIFAGKYRDADALALKMQGEYTQSYMPLGQLILEFKGQRPVLGYHRELDLTTGIATSLYSREGVRFRQEVFVSAPDQVMVVRLSADTPASLSFDVTLKSLLRHHTASQSDRLLVMKGRCPIHVEPDYRGDVSNAVVYDNTGQEGISFDARLLVRAQAGQVLAQGDRLTVAHANEVVLLVSAGTSFNGFDTSPGLAGRDPEQQAKQSWAQALDKSYAQIRADHVIDFQSLFGRVSLDLTSEADIVPTDKRLAAFDATDPDLHLEELLFQYGRYLLISSSRPGGVPANLQGIWSHKLRPPWSDNFTNNINIEMNYWPAEVCNLSELHEPMLRLIRDLAVNGAKTARVNYGLDGWCVHHNSDIWASTNPVGNWGQDGQGSVRWANWPMAGAWYCQHLWEHYVYTGDRAFLRDQAYPLMKGAAEFLQGWLIPGPEGMLVTNPSTSPENSYRTDQGVVGNIQMASTMDITLCKELFKNLVKATEVLGVDASYAEALKAILQKLPPYKIGKHGQLHEWYFDWDSPDDKHRHISHMYGLYPGYLISPDKTPALAKACRQSMIMRGDEGTGWSSAWKTCVWARLKDGDKAHSLLDYLLRYVDPGNYSRGNLGGGCYPNLLGACPPFMIDGSFGVTAGMAEMLLQSHVRDNRDAVIIQLLPALPSVWQAGQVKGLRARDGFEVSIIWKHKALQRVTIKSLLGKLAILECAGRRVSLNLKKGQSATFNTQLNDISNVIVTDADLAAMAGQVKNALAATTDPTKIPRRIDEKGDLVTVGIYSWTSGFFAGNLWYLYELTGEAMWKEEAARWTAALAPIQHWSGNHDVGFMMNCSYGNGLRLTHEQAYESVLVNTAESLSKRYNPVTKCIESWDKRDAWDGTHWDYPVIIDNMMNLELLFKASRVSGQRKYYDIAVQHALTTMKDHYRENFSCYHVVDYDTKTGEVEDKATCQGFTDESSWARGQAWGLYGFCICYRYTQDPKFLDFAKNIADYMLNHARLPQDGVPLWDYQAGQKGWTPQWDYDPTEYPVIPRDASAAAITCSALFELADLTGKSRYRTEAIRLLTNLTRDYRAQANNRYFILDHSVGSIPHGVEIDVPLVYADYYYLEALVRCRATQ